MDAKPEDKVKIVLTRPALERLVGGDSEAEVQIRHAAAREIIEKHIVPCVGQEAIQSVVRQIKHQVDEYIKENIGTYSVKWDWKKHANVEDVSIVDRFKQALKLPLKKSFDEAMKKAVHEVKREWEADITARLADYKTYLEEHLDRKVERMTKEVIEERARGLLQDALTGQSDSKDNAGS